ncbi:YcdB/YcdC domain-containing protein [Tissierella sp. Yu-01]|uniref:YcdB/YcdC domain-containing protein n=1 Tax=Tissierella sp. Yu-01 TaxID=3035694 RepID=UPI00240DECDC|nr:YcdB/YcdC domain-containing protein [Tissierella sp. Yu-01]WFA10281.1 S-layer homology domain-containing protein [Tissierella sp. Yu-01]
MRKSFIICIAALVLLTTMPIGVYGDSAIDKNLETVILKVKDLFDISNEYDTFNSHVNSRGNSFYFYLNWSDSNSKLDTINITTDSSGNIISYSKYNPNYVEPETKLPNYTRDEALKLAKEFIGKIDSNVYKELRLKENRNPIRSNDIDYGFSFIRNVNGVPYPDNTVSINVNKFTGEVNNYHTNWDREIHFPRPDDVISMDEGKQAYRDNIGLDLMYKTTYRTHRIMDENQDFSYYLAYSLLDSNKAIDALTGEAIALGHYGPIYENEKSMDSVAGEGSNITPEERAEVEKLSGIIDIGIIEKEARNILDLGSDHILQSKNLYSSHKNPGEYQWSLYFIEKNDDNNGLNVNISLNAKTSELISFYKYDNYDSKNKASINKDEALELAKNYINKIQPNKANELELIEENLKDGQLSYHFRFIRKVDDIYVESDSISVTVDTVNKDITSYNFDWFNGQLPPVGELKGLDKAYEVLFNDIGYELKYATIYDYERPEDENKEVKLVYAVNQEIPMNIDALTGELLDYSGEPYKNKKDIEYTDIDDSYAKDKIRTLWEYGVGFNSTDFKPKDKIKQRDFIYLLFKSQYSYRTETEEDIDKIYEELSNTRIIRDGEKSPEKVVTKEEAVKFIIRAMNYDKVADISNIYTDLFDDSQEINSTFRGYINIAYGLGIINGDGTGNIKPKIELSREDAASIIYNYMFN